MGRTAILIAAVAMLAVAASCDSGGGDMAVTPAFNSERAFGYLESQVAFGPRVPGTAAHDNAMGWIMAQLGRNTSMVNNQAFTAEYDGEEIAMNNILAAFQQDNENRILLCAHWDSRKYADRDPDPANHTAAVPGANDGASGVAVLLEIANVIARENPPLGVDIVLFDGEDGGSYSDNTGWILGSRYFAGTLPDSYKPKYVILLDMIGDSDLALTPDTTSMSAAPELWSRVTALAQAHGVPMAPQTMNVLDDHVPLINRGLRAVDLIDFDYPSWHTIADTPDKCSPESLGKIGAIVLDIIYGG